MEMMSQGVYSCRESKAVAVIDPRIHAEREKEPKSGAVHK